MSDIDPDRLRDTLRLMHQGLMEPDESACATGGCGGPPPASEPPPAPPPHKVMRGESVLDMSAGSGFDTFLIYSKTGPQGTILGLTVSEATAEAANKRARDGKFTGISFLAAPIEAVPVNDGWFNVALSDGALVLCEDLGAALKETHRVLARGGRLTATEVLGEGALDEQTLRDALDAAGFERTTITRYEAGRGHLAALDTGWDAAVPARITAVKAE